MRPGCEVPTAATESRNNHSSMPRLVPEKYWPSVSKPIPPASTAQSRARRAGRMAGDWLPVAGRRESNRTPALSGRSPAPCSASRKPSPAECFSERPGRAPSRRAPSSPVKIASATAIRAAHTGENSEWFARSMVTYLFSAFPIRKSIRLARSVVGRLSRPTETTGRGRPTLRLSTVREITVRFPRGVSFQLAEDSSTASWKLTPLTSRTVLTRR